MGREVQNESNNLVYSYLLYIALESKQGKKEKEEVIYLNLPVTRLM